MKKILFVSAANSIHTVKWVNSLCKRFEIHLVYCKNHKANIDSIDKSVFLHELKFNSPAGYYLNIFQLRKIFNDIKPDLVNVHYASGYGTLVRLSKVKPILLSVWGSDIYDFPHKSKLNSKILKKNVLYADYIASTSKVMAKELMKEVPKLENEIFITPFGVDTNKFKNIKVKRDNNINIGIVKSLKKIYGIQYSILAIRKLKDKLYLDKKQELSDSIKFYIYGDGEEKDNLINIIKEQNLIDSVFLKGRISNDSVPEILNTFDIFCATSIKESFGVAIIEAMACQLPVVATNVDGFKEILSNNEAGYIVNNMDVNEIADALKEIVINKTLRDKMGKKGRKIVLEKYDWKKNVEIMCCLYDAIINKLNK